MRRTVGACFVATWLAASATPGEADSSPPAAPHSVVLDAGTGKPVVTIPRIDEPPRIDDFLGMEPEGPVGPRMARIEGGFVQRLPVDGKPASHTTHVFLGYDDASLHAVFVAFDPEPEKIRASLGRRESMFGDDIVQIMLDTFKDERRAYSFVSNPLGVQFDAIWTEGSDFDRTFDTVWESEGRLTERGFVVRMAIPFRSLRFPEAEEQVWGILLNRDVPRASEETFWPQYTNRIQGRLNQMGTLRGLRGVSPGRNLQLIPFGAARSFRLLDPEAPGGPAFVSESGDADIGLDAKWVLRDRFVVDATANPDFSQVESDEPQVTANQRFEVFFPEKRPFFLENGGYFRTPLNLLFTRRIGDPRLGGRLTGKTGPWAFGALLIDDEAPGLSAPAGDPLAGERARFGVVRVARDVLDQSSVGFILTDREFAGSRNRVGGADARLKWNDHWSSTAQVVASRTRGLDGASMGGEAWVATLSRRGRHFLLDAGYRSVAPEFRTRAGFVPRVDIRRSFASAEYVFRPEGRKLLSSSLALGLDRVEDHDGLRLDEAARPRILFAFPRRTEVAVAVRSGRERLRPSDAPGLVEPADFPVGEIEIDFKSRPTQRFGVDLEFGWGRAIHLDPPHGAPPERADVVVANLESTLRLSRRLRVDTNLVYTRLEPPEGGGRFFANRIARVKGSLQFTPAWSLRAILQHEALSPDPARSALERIDALNADLLLTYQANPWTALYVGTNSNWENLALVDDPSGPRVTRTAAGRIRDSRQVFVKLSYLVRL